MWHWDKDDPGCSLEQQTEGGSAVAISRAPGQDATLVGFTVRSPKFWKGLYEDGSIILSSGASFPATIQVYSAQNRQYRLVATVTDPQFAKDLAGSTTVTFAHPDFGKFSVSPSKLGAAVTAVRSCEDAKMRDWGIDVGAYWALASRPRPIGHLVDLFNSDNYPAVAAMAAMERNVIATVEVGTDGRIGSCSAPGHFAYPQFVSSVCNVLRKGARFEPARDSEGKAVAAPYVVLVSFRLRGS